MSDHKYVINVKTGVVHGRNKSLDGHPDCRPYYPEDAPKPVEAPAVEAPKRRKAKSEGVSAAAAAVAAAESAISATAAIEEVDFTNAATSAGAEE